MPSGAAAGSSHERDRELQLTVVGAGSVGASVAYAALIAGRLGTSPCMTSRGREGRGRGARPRARDAVHGSSDITGGADVSVAEGSHVVVITAGAKQNPGQTRTELAATKRSHHRRHDAEAARGSRRTPCTSSSRNRATCSRSSLTRGRGCRHPGSSPRAPSRHLAPALEDRRSARGSPLERAREDRGRARRHRVPLWSTATIGSVRSRSSPFPTVPVSTRGNWMPSPSTCATRPYKVIKGKGATNLRHRSLQRPASSRPSCATSTRSCRQYGSRQFHGASAGRPCRCRRSCRRAERYPSGVPPFGRRAHAGAVPADALATVRAVAARLSRPLSAARRTADGRGMPRPRRSDVGGPA